MCTVPQSSALRDVSGLCTLPQVARQPCERCASSPALSLDQARQQIDLLMRTAPHWIKEENGSGSTLGKMLLQLRIDRKLKVLDVRVKVVCTAALALQDDADADAVVSD